MALDLRIALNTLSDIVNNRPLPLREFDQIYMKIGDLVVHAEFTARRLDGRDVVFVGDGDAVGLAIAHLMASGVIEYGPKHITILDFDERVVQSVNRFAANYGIADRIDARLYNVIDAVPEDLVGQFGAFHINPPWGQYNSGESVLVFLERAIQLLGDGGVGVIVIAYDPELRWTTDVIRRTQLTTLQNGLIVDEMIPSFHHYHLDDAPDLRSCSIIVRKIGGHSISNEPLSAARLENFYGRSRALRVRYVRDIPTLDAGSAPKGTYRLEPLEEVAKDD